MPWPTPRTGAEELASGVGPGSDGWFGQSLVDGKPDAIAIDLEGCVGKLVAEGAVRPVYPSRMRAAGVQGTVVVDFVVTKKGDVSEARVLSVTTSPELGGQARREAESQFGAAAISAVNQWKFQPVETQMQRPVNFVLTEKFK